MTLTGSSPARLLRELLDAIPLTAIHVLELGCGDGSLAAAWKRRNPQGVWTGIEADPAAAARAGAVCDTVICASPERMPAAVLDAALGDRRPDVLLLTCGVGSANDPAGWVADLAGRLMPDATVLMLVRNPAHWAAIAELMHGRDGIPGLQPDAIAALCRRAGLVPDRIVACADNPAATAGADALAAAAPALGVEPGQAAARLRVPAYVATARRSPASPTIRLHQHISAPGYMAARNDPPWQALASIPGVLASSSTIPDAMRLPQTGPDDPRILVLQRMLVLDRVPWLASVAGLAARGWLLVAEWDDHPALLPDSVRVGWDLNPWLPVTAMHAVQVSTPALATAFGEHNPNVAVLPNALLELPPLPPKQAGTVRVVYAALRRPDIAPLVVPALLAAAARPEVEIVIVGDDALGAALPTARKRILPLQSYTNYLALLAEADVMLLPLAGHGPELFKSPLKYIESAARGAVCICSPAVYAGTVRHDETAIIASTPDEWTRALDRLVTDASLRHAIAQAAWTDVRDHHLQAHHVGQRLAWYRDLWADRARLRRDLAARHPEMPRG